MLACALRNDPTARILVTTDNAKLRTALVSHDATNLAIPPPAKPLAPSPPGGMEPWAYATLDLAHSGGASRLQRVHAWAGPPRAESLVFGATNESAMRKVDAMGELRLKGSFVELGLMAGSSCIVPSPKTDYQ